MDEIRFGAIAPAPPLLELLASCGLPTGDLHDGRALHLYGAWHHKDLIGSVGIEVCGEAGLLRSLAVAPTWRGRRLGDALLQHAQCEAIRLALRELWLLTRDAEQYFRRHGFAPADRTMAPAAIRATPQFSGLCPASAHLMFKAVANW